MIRLSWRPLAALLTVAGCLIALVAYWGRTAGERLQLPQDVPPAEVSRTEDHGYVGWSVCAECHERRVDEFHETRHFQALRLPDQVAFPPGFDAGSDPFLPFGSPKRFSMTALPTPNITTSSLHRGSEPENVSPIAFIYGSGAGTDEVYFSRRGDELFEMPVVWLHAENCWGSSLFDPYGTGDLSRPLTPQCLECHTVWVDYQRGSLNRYGPFNPQLLGVTCERCHGPAKDHVAHHRAHPTDTIPTAIVRPKSLSRERQMDLCAQCHTNTVRHRRPPFSYRPGEPLEDSFLVLEMEFPEQDRVANQVRYLKESRCYQESEQLTCVTCHDPHRKSSTSGPQSSSLSCSKCHQEEACSARTRVPQPIQDQCVACHMPRRNKVQVNFLTTAGDVVFPAPRYEHRIGIYPEAEQELLSQWLETQRDSDSQLRRTELGSKLNEHWQQVGDAAKNAQRFVVAIDAYRKALQFADSMEIRDDLADVQKRNQQSDELWFKGAYFKREGKFDEAIATLTSLLMIEPKLAKAHLALGTLYAAKNRQLEAVKHIQLAREYDVNDPGASAMLGWLDLLNGKPSEALEHYLQAEKIEPWSDRIELMIGQCHVQLGRWEEASQAFERALTIDPHQTEAARALRRILRERFSLNEGLTRSLVAVEITAGKQADLLLTLTEIYRDLKRIPDAQKTIIAARRIAEREDISLLPQIRAVERALNSGM